MENHLTYQSLTGDIFFLSKVAYIQYTCSTQYKIYFHWFIVFTFINTYLYFHCVYFILGYKYACFLYYCHNWVDQTKENN
jgi:hypothetical protein